MNYLSVCSGIEAATVAWHHMGWNPVAFSEIEKFPSEVLKHHYPHVPNLGDMTKYKEWELNAPIDILVGGTPCQSFSVAGLRKGLEDPRGNLALTYVGILDKFRPKWFVWENVPGVLSSNGGRDFGSFLGAVVELGYGFSYRVLDAQYFGVAQRRRRVFVVGHLGDWRPAAEVLFESESLQRHLKPSRKKGKEITADVIKCFAGNQPTDIASTLQTTCHDWSRSDGFNMVTFDERNIRSFVNSNFKTFPSLCASDFKGAKSICYALQGAGSTSQNANGDGYKEEQCYTLNRIDMHGVAYGFEPGIAQREGNPNRFTEEQSPTLRANMGDNQVATVHAFKMRGGCEGGGKGYLGSDEKTFTISTTQDQQIAILGGQHPNAAMSENISPTLTNAMGTGGGHIPIIGQMAVRRLTTVECERLQGFPNNYTKIKDNCPDGPRYKALGNSMAVPVMKWIGERINANKSS
jgi:DNA (cytosine-5)-methyltransferase 1